MAANREVRHRAASAWRLFIIGRAADWPIAVSSGEACPCTRGCAEQMQ